VVQRVCEAALEELANVGYAALSIEEVAKRAGVHKTTVYRRWPTKRELMRETLIAYAGEQFPTPDTGSFRQDLIITLRGMAYFSSTLHGRSIIRMLMSETGDPEVLELCENLRKSKEPGDRAMIDRAVARGEVRPEVDRDMLFATLFGSLHAHTSLLGRNVDDLFIHRLVDLVLMGAAPESHSGRSAKPRGKQRSGMSTSSPAKTKKK
jgi:AcrR family transcriptional regulator